jgi:hypothetical protein
MFRLAPHLRFLGTAASTQLLLPLCRGQTLRITEQRFFVVCHGTDFCKKLRGP